MLQLAPGLVAQPTTITDAERQYAVGLLEQPNADLLKTVAGLPPTQLAYKTDSTRWAITQCIEPITLAEMGIFPLQQGAVKAPANPAKRAEIRVTDQQVVKILTNRSGKAQSPAIIRPTGRFPAVEAALQTHGQPRERAIAYLQTTTDDLRTHFWQHPATGTIDAYQTLLLASHHERHRLQEVKDANGFPLQ